MINDASKATRKVTYRKVKAEQVAEHCDVKGERVVIGCPPGGVVGLVD